MEIELIDGEYYWLAPLGTRGVYELGQYRFDAYWGSGIFLFCGNECEYEVDGYTVVSHIPMFYK